MIIMGEFKLFLGGPGKKIKRPPTMCRRLESEIRSFSFFLFIYRRRKRIVFVLAWNQIVFVLKLKRFRFYLGRNWIGLKLPQVAFSEIKTFSNSGVFVSEFINSLKSRVNRKPNKIPTESIKTPCGPNYGP
jgi:hypothetical protein